MRLDRIVRRMRKVKDDSDLIHVIAQTHLLEQPMVYIHDGLSNCGSHLRDIDHQTSLAKLGCLMQQRSIPGDGHAHSVVFLLNLDPGQGLRHHILLRRRQVANSRRGC